MLGRVLSLFGYHTCADCARRHDVSTISWPVKKGTGSGTVDITVMGSLCADRPIDYRALKKCWYFRKK